MEPRVTFLLPVLIAGLCLLPVGRMAAQNFTTLHSFTDDTAGRAGLIISGSTLYGPVFKVNTDGSGFTNLHNFTAAHTNALGFYTNSDGVGSAGPGGVILSGNTLYGTTVGGGSSGSGTVFALSTNGTGFTNIYIFTELSSSLNGTNSDGSGPNGVILSGNTLYGTTDVGGSSVFGTVFAVNTDGTGFTNLHSFTGYDGFFPYAGVILLGNTLYGTAYGRDGPYSGGTVFKVNADGTGFTNVYTLTDPNIQSGMFAGLVSSGNTLYGTAADTGSSGNGTIFSVNTDGSGFTNLYGFTATTTNASGVYTNSDGVSGVDGLVLSGNTLYGTAPGGGSSGNGTVFALSTNGTGFTNLHSFTATSTNASGDYTNSDGANPQAGLLLSGNTLYGVTVSGGAHGKGTVFSIALPLAPPQLTIIRSGTNAILTWPTNAIGFTLKSTTNLSQAVWTSNSLAPAVVNGQNTVTNPISGTRKFYRLSQ